jgi:starch phosphorylase
VLEDRPPFARPAPGESSLYDRLWTLARNLWWTWHPEVAALFRELDPIRWRQLDHNPVALLSEFTIQKLEAQAEQLVLRGPIHYAYRRLQEYLRADDSWGATQAGVLCSRPVAYFSAEFGLHESLPIYSGGLGVLAGDHLKSASHLGIPLVAVGLLYHHGYFLQRLNREDWQQEESLTIDVTRLPLEPATTPNGQPIFVTIETRRGPIIARIWKVAVGRCTLLLLDAEIKENRQEDRELTAHLYDGDNRIRIRQELLLGVGGVRALQALNIHPGVIHLNEGHSAFAALEVIRQRMKTEGIGFDEARYRVAQRVVFTTHTPVPAGHDRFPADLVEEHLGPLREELALTAHAFMGLGRLEPNNSSEPLCMTVLGLKLCQRANAVSALQGGISRRMWAGVWPQRAVADVPIGHITNGIHVLTWLAPQIEELFDRYLGLDWKRHMGRPEAWQAIANLEDGELWEAHQVLKVGLLDFVRRRVALQCQRRGESSEAVEQARQVLNINALTVGFARRFASYKRATLLLHDLPRLARLVNNPQRPIQLVFAGKAHPHDVPGKQLLQQIARLTHDPQFAGRLAFVEDYDINVCRHFVQGVDVWLNTPRRPQEACGTSGQKVVLNGGLNLSILDGWWAEAYDGSNGFAIGRGETHSSPDVQDERDANDLYRTLEQEVIPLYYERDADGLPVNWIARMKRAMRTLGWRFNADRMVMDYVLGCYLPAAGGLSSDPKHAAAR